MTTTESPNDTWIYLYRVVDKHGKTLDLKLAEGWNKVSPTRFFARALAVNGLRRKIVNDKSVANTAGIKAINKMLAGFGCPIPIEIVRRKYLKNIIKQDHRFIKRQICPMLSFKSFASAAGIETANMIRRGQFAPGVCPFR